MQKALPSRSHPRAWHKTIIEIPALSIRAAACIMPSADELSDPMNPARAGLVRHGGVPRPINHVPKLYKHEYGVHVQHYLKTSNERARRTILLLGSRNSFQNLLLPLWLNGRLIVRFDEPWQTTIYTALCKLTSGRLVIQRIRFQDGEMQENSQGDFSFRRGSRRKGLARGLSRGVKGGDFQERGI